MVSENSEIGILYSDSATKKGNWAIKPAKLAPAPTETSNEGRAQQNSVDEDANSEEILARLAFICMWARFERYNFKLSYILAFS